MRMNDSPAQLAAVIMAGGAGTRFWPLSTEERPKQFLTLFGEQSLLQQSYGRLEGLIPPERIIVATSERYVGLVREQIPQLPAENIIGEPKRRDTAAAVALTALLCRERFGDPVICVLTADHMISPAGEFRRELLSAAGAASGSGALYTFGIPPAYPATCYGYLEQGELLLEDNGIQHFRLLRFKEKPDSDTAASYLAEGRYHWNSGMFVWRAGAILDELARQLPEHIRLLEPVVKAWDGPGRGKALAGAFERLESTSVDYGVMEGAKQAALVAAGFQWNDVGGWLALEEYLEHDCAGNAHRGALETLDASGNLVFCEDSGESVALLGVSGLIVVRAGGKTLVLPKERAEQIKTLVRSLKT